MSVTNTELAGRMEKIEGALAKIADRLEAIETTTAETRDIVDAWRTVQGIGKFLKWAGAIIAVLASATGAIIGAVAAFRGLRH